MITDRDRREVAARIRERLSEGKDRYLDVLIGNAMSGCVPDGVTYGETVADLIDRQTCHVQATDHEFEDSVRCDRCHKTFARPWEPFNYCPNCGAEVVDR